MRSDRIRLVKFVNSFFVGGTERLFVDLGLSLDPSRFALHYACFRRKGLFLREVETRQIPLVEYTLNRLHGPRALKQQLRFARYARRAAIEIVHTYGFHANVFATAVARLAGVRVIVTSVQDMGIHLTPAKGRVQRLMCRWTDRIVANAEAVRQRLIADGYDPARITVIRSGVDVARFTNKTAGRGIRQALGLPPGSPLVAVLSRVDRIKGIEYFLEAMATMADRFKDVHFLIVGDGDVAYQKELESYGTRLGLDGRVVFTGARTDVPEILSEVTVSVLPSLSEGLSTAILESMAAGVPVVATRVGGNAEAVEDGVTGLLVAPRDAAALGRAVCLLLENADLRHRLGRAGRQRAADRFSLERMVRETERLYEDLMVSSKSEARHGR